MKKRVKVFFIFAVICVCSVCGLWKSVRAGEEQGAEVSAWNGVLAFENEQSRGVLEVIYGGEHRERVMVSCDYSELEVPLDQRCILVVHPFTGYEVNQVLVNGEYLEGQELVYRIDMNEYFVTVSVDYEKVFDQADISKDWSEKGVINSQNEEAVIGNGKEDMTAEKSDSEGPDRIRRNPNGIDGVNSVSAISRDVKVIYLDDRDSGEKEKPVSVEPEKEKPDKNQSDKRKTTIVGKDGNHTTLQEDFAENMFEETREKQNRGNKFGVELEQSHEKIQDVLSLDRISESQNQKSLIREMEDKADSEENDAERRHQSDKLSAAENNVKLEPSETADWDGESDVVADEKTSQIIKTKSVQIISILPLYLFLSCCMIIVRLVAKLIFK